MALNEDISVFFSDFARAAVWTPRNGDAAKTGDVILDYADETFNAGMVEAVGRYTSILYASETFPGLDNGEPITVDGIEYFVRGTPRAVEDGAFTLAWLGKYGNTN